MGRFDAGERAWIERLASLRNIVRQDLIGRQLAEHVTAGMRVLDVGCGQGTQAIRLARRGCFVLGVDPSREMLQRLSMDAQDADVTVESRLGTLEDLSRVVGERTFDLVCAHGLLMYLPDTRSALELLAARVTVLSGGRIIAEGTPAEVTQDAEVIRAYLGDEVVA